jgi:hypothetical protein
VPEYFKDLDFALHSAADLLGGYLGLVDELDGHKLFRYGVFCQFHLA